MQQAAIGKSKQRIKARAKPKRTRAARRACLDDQLKAAGIDCNAPVPADIDEFRNAMARRISILIANDAGYWRSCKEAACRRAHACLAPHIHCSNAPPLPPMSPEEEARRRAEVLRALKQTIERNEREQG
jgi:hypothetical protein